MELIWRSGSRVHDWTGGEHVRELIAHWAELGAVGDATWCTDSFGGPRRERSVPKGDLASAAVDVVSSGDGTVSMGGSWPGAWQFHLVVTAWNPGLGAADGANMATVRFGAEALSQGAGPGAGSDRLFEVFTRAHTPDDSEFALIHPYEHFMHLAGDVYRPPLVNSNMVAGAYWALFIGPGQIDFFDIEALIEVPAVRVRRADWHTDRRGVWLQCLPALSDAASPAGERELVILTGALRSALRPDTP